MISRERITNENVVIYKIYLCTKFSSYTEYVDFLDLNLFNLYSYPNNIRNELFIIHSPISYYRNNDPESVTIGVVITEIHRTCINFRSERVLLKRGTEAEQNRK